LKTEVRKILNGGNLTPDDRLWVIETEEYGLLDRNAVWFGDSPMFFRHTSCPSSVAA
jgi:hypothetical protein